MTIVITVTRYDDGPNTPREAEIHEADRWSTERGFWTGMYNLAGGHYRCTRRQSVILPEEDEKTETLVRSILGPTDSSQMLED